MIRFLIVLLAVSPITAATEREVAARFAPVFYQALGDNPRSDYIASFDFDGDWRGDNNWENAADKRFPLKAHVYYAVAETATHYFIHYAVFHPRDYKGGEQRGPLLSTIIRQGSEILGDRDPTGLASEVTAAHENDLEGALIVVEKLGKGVARARVVFLETVFHNTFTKWARQASGFPAFTADRERPILYIEPRGHGIDAFTGDSRQTEGKKFVVYKYAGKAETSVESKHRANVLVTAAAAGSSAPVVGYNLIPISATLWPRARLGAGKMNATYGASHEYGSVSIQLRESGSATTRTVETKLGVLGSAFLGGQNNMARPPWTWFDHRDRETTPGKWFFDPAALIRRDFRLDEAFSTVYTSIPFWAKKNG